MKTSGIISGDAPVSYWPVFFPVATGADPGFFSGGGALVSCSTSTPINHIVFFQNTSCIRKPQVISGGGGVHLLHPPSGSAPAPVTVPEVFANFTWPRCPLISKVANNIMFACAIDHKILRAGIKNKRFYTSSFSSLMKLLKLRYFGNVILLTQRKAQKMLLQGQKSILSV